MGVARQVASARVTELAFVSKGGPEPPAVSSLFLFFARSEDALALYFVTGDCLPQHFGTQCQPCPEGCTDCDDGLTGTGLCLDPVASNLTLPSKARSLRSIVDTISLIFSSSRVHRCLQLYERSLSRKLDEFKLRLQRGMDSSFKRNPMRGLFPRLLHVFLR